jgi:hypothetical protein
MHKLIQWLFAGLLVQACHSNAQFPGNQGEPILINCDERVDDWRLDGESHCPRHVKALDGCYVVRVKYSEDYLQLHGRSAAWVLSPWSSIAAAAALLDAAGQTHSAHYETGYVPFALPVRSKHSYYVTATFNGDEFTPRILELNADQERTQEIFPARSRQDLEQCRAHGPAVTADDQDVCAIPAQPIQREQLW